MNESITEPITSGLSVVKNLFHNSLWVILVTVLVFVAAYIFVKWKLIK